MVLFVASDKGFDMLVGDEEFDNFNEELLLSGAADDDLEGVVVEDVCEFCVHSC